MCKSKKFNLIVFILTVAIITVFSGCVQKQKKEPIIKKNHQEQKINNNDNQKQQKIIASTSVEQIIPPVKIDCQDELDVSCWNTYRNEECGYQIKYPGNWQVKFADNQQTPRQVHFISHTKFNFINKEKMNDAEVIIASNKNIANYSSPDQFDFGDQVGPLIKSKDIKLDNRPARQYIFEGTNQLAFPKNTIPLITSIVGFVDMHQIIEIAFNGSGKNRYQFLEIFNKMIQTFKFIDK